MVIASGLLVFGAVFALKLVVHSYLILDYTDGGKVTCKARFYHRANAGGRLVGCLLSGVLYQVAGLAGFLWGAFALVVIAAVVALKLPQGGEPQLDCGLLTQTD